MGKCIRADMKGKRYFDLLVLAYSHTKGGKAYWYVQCVCENKKTVRGEHLRAGKVKSCGYLNRKKCKLNPITHGMSKTPIYTTWQAMKDRCFNTKADNYINYGGRGITVCDRWVNSFENFIIDMGPRPEGKTLDRINNNKNYSPENCQWSTPKVQASNRRNSKIISYKGLSLTVAEWAGEIGVKVGTLYSRLYRDWPLEKALR